MIYMKDYIQQFLENLRFSKRLILLLAVSWGLTISLIGTFLERNYMALSFSFFYIVLRIYKNLQ